MHQHDLKLRKQLKMLLPTVVVIAGGKAADMYA